MASDHLPVMASLELFPPSDRRRSSRLGLLPSPGSTLPSMGSGVAFQRLGKPLTSSNLPDDISSRPLPQHALH
eukprot:7262687-Pyramimonas_sp.AAC.1